MNDVSRCHAVSVALLRKAQERPRKRSTRARAHCISISSSVDLPATRSCSMRNSFCKLRDRSCRPAAYFARRRTARGVGREGGRGEGYDAELKIISADLAALFFSDLSLVSLARERFLRPVTLLFPRKRVKCRAWSQR